MDVAQRSAGPSRRGYLVLGVVLALLVVAALGAWLAGRYANRSRFEAAPPGCATIAPLVRLLGEDYTLTDKGAHNCDLRLPADHPAYVDAPKITAGYALAESPKEASDRIQSLPDTQPIDGLGDEAYRWSGNVVARVSNLVVVVMVFPEPASSPGEVEDFAAALVGAADG